MDQPITIGILRKELEETNAKFKKELRLNLFEAPEKHPYAFIILLASVYFAVSLWYSVGEKLVKKYIVTKELKNTEIILLASFFTIIVWYVYKKYRFTISNIQ